ncbi:NAD-dependent epimerase/dehydratase family protein [Dactylosporangium sp. CA-139066]|uniref:NAD-dependent epimerase/dehydratase family protein n=1 Tax=Dactylosporangium sp. CA-139066 TaxID=3239930 RepID=UPI003D92EA2E
MRLLIVGGTQFVGRHITEAALRNGHDVTLLHRGRTGADLFPEAAHVLADRDGDLSGLAGRRFDATIDVSAYRPEQVRRLAAALGEPGQYVFISSVSAYDQPPPGFAEDGPLYEPNDTDYGPLKVACERAAAEVFGPGTLIVRPTYVIGPHDHLVRFTWWVERIARGGEVLAPGRFEEPIQYIDARDMAAWILAMAEAGRPGVFHAAAPAWRPAKPFSFGDLLEAVRDAVGPPGTTLTWVDPQFLLERGLTGEELPLWPAPDPDAAVNAADPSAAFAAGLTPRPLADTIRDCLADGRANPREAPQRLGAGREAELLREWSGGSGSSGSGQR